MIEMMDYYTKELEERLERLERLSKTDEDDVNLVPDDVTLNIESAQSFSNCKTAVMMLHLDSASAKLGSDCSLAEVVRAAVVTHGEVIVVQEAWNSVIVAVGPNASQSTGTPVAQLLALTKEVSNEVGIVYVTRLTKSKISTLQMAVKNITEQYFGNILFKLFE